LEWFDVLVIVFGFCIVFHKIYVAADNNKYAVMSDKNQTDL